MFLFVYDLIPDSNSNMVYNQLVPSTILLQFISNSNSNMVYNQFTLKSMLASLGLIQIPIWSIINRGIENEVRREDSIQIPIWSIINLSGEYAKLIEAINSNSNMVYNQ